MTVNINIQTYDGPLDVLLHLIEKAELDIKDISISEITTQYIEYIHSLEALDMDIASEFLTMATRLLYIKSRSLLPKPPKEQLEIEEEDPEVALIRQLQEYKAFKEASAKMNDLSILASHSRTKLPEEFMLPEQEVVFKGGTASELFEAFKRIIKRCDDEKGKNDIPQNTISAEQYTIRSCMQDIRDTLIEKGEVTFEELFEAEYIKIKVIVTFMALLEMVMRGELIIKQAIAYEPIRIIKGSPIESNGELNYDEIEELY